MASPANPKPPFSAAVLDAMYASANRVWGECVLYSREITEGPHAGMKVQVLDMLYNHRLVLAYPKELDGYETGFCMPKNFNAVREAEAWDGESDPVLPWIKKVGTERIGPAHPRYDHQKDLYPHLDESAEHHAPTRTRASHSGLP